MKKITFSQKGFSMVMATSAMVIMGIMTLFIMDSVKMMSGSSKNTTVLTHLSNAEYAAEQYVNCCKTVAAALGGTIPPTLTSASFNSTPDFDLLAADGTNLNTFSSPFRMRAHVVPTDAAQTYLLVQFQHTVPGTMLFTRDVASTYQDRKDISSRGALALCSLPKVVSDCAADSSTATGGGGGTATATGSASATSTTASGTAMTASGTATTGTSASGTAGSCTGGCSTGDTCQCSGSTALQSCVCANVATLVTSTASATVTGSGSATATSTALTSTSTALTSTSTALTSTSTALTSTSTALTSTSTALTSTSTALTSSSTAVTSTSTGATATSTTGGLCVSDVDCGYGSGFWCKGGICKVPVTTDFLGACVCGLYTSPKTGGACFIAGTLIDTPKGKVKIEEIRAGDQVYGFDTESKKVVVQKVAKTFLNSSKDFYLVRTLSNGTIVATTEHPFFSIDRKKWVPASQLKTFEKVLRREGAKTFETQILYTEKISGPSTKTYNFQVDDVHDYFANGILVHNASCLATETADYSCTPSCVVNTQPAGYTCVSMGLSIACRYDPLGDGISGCNGVACPQVTMDFTCSL